MATAKKLHRRRNEAVCKKLLREIKLDTTNTLWSDLADRCFEEFKKSKLKTTIHYLVVGDLLGNNANHPTYFTTIEEALLAGKRV
jgi:hypothetical protein